MIKLVAFVVSLLLFSCSFFNNAEKAEAQPKFIDSITLVF